MKPEIAQAIREVLEAYKSQDSNELATAIYQLKRIYKKHSKIA